MFFLLRMAFWLGLVLVLLPTDKTPDADKAPEVATSDAISAATAAVSDMSQFCTRQPAACAVGGQAATVIGARAQNGARKVYHFITDKAEGKAESKTLIGPEKPEKKSPDHTGSIASLDDDVDTGGITHQTLTQEDLQMEWQPPAAEPVPAP
jgi:Family of unknown function (DUF5330)